jgi:hypothetical protein
MESSDRLSKDSVETLGRKLPCPMPSKLMANIFFTLQSMSFLITPKKSLIDDYYKEEDNSEMKSDDRLHLMKPRKEEIDLEDLKNNRTPSISSFSNRSKLPWNEKEKEEQTFVQIIFKIINFYYRKK